MGKLRDILLDVSRVDWLRGKKWFRNYCGVRLAKDLLEPTLASLCREIRLRLSSIFFPVTNGSKRRRFGSLSSVSILLRLIGLVLSFKSLINDDYRARIPFSSSSFAIDFLVYNHFFCFASFSSTALFYFLATRN